MLGTELEYIQQAIEHQTLTGDGYFTKKASQRLEEQLGSGKVLLTPSCTAALEMAAILIDLKPGDEVIMPSYTFVSTANAFALRGAKIVFVDVDKNTMNVNPDAIEEAINKNTKAIIPVHYAGVACDMNAIMALAEKHCIYVIEDAAQAIDSYHQGKSLGTLGHFGCFSFHGTKNITSGGEGGALVINDERFVERAEVIREKGTNRSQFFRGAVDKYSWVDIGSSFLPSELQAAYLYAQLLDLEKITKKRLQVWHQYQQAFQELECVGKVTLPKIPAYATNNAHMFYIKCESLKERTGLIHFLKEQGITAVFHYVPLHSSIAGEQLGHFCGNDEITTKESEKLMRLPLFYNMGLDEVDQVISAIMAFYTREFS